MRRASLSALHAAGRRQPWSVLLVLVAFQIVGAVVFALSVPRNGWLFYHGGDQFWYVTTGWLLGLGEMPIAHVGHGWPLALAPLVLVSGREFIGLLPPLIAANVLVVGPLATLGMYGIGARIGGRLLGYWLAALWVAVPFVTMLLVLPKYEGPIVEQFLPQMVGLTSQADFPSIALLIAAAYFTLVALQERQLHAAVFAGLLTGAAASIKPSNLLFLAGVGLAFIAAGRIREAGMFGAGIAPALGVLALWKAKGLGELPLFLAETTRLATGRLEIEPLERYGVFDWELLSRNISAIDEVLRGGLLLTILPLLGVAAVARRAPAAALLFGGWLGAFIVIKGASEFASTENGSFFRLVSPAFPAYLALSALVLPLLLELGPKARTRRADAPGVPIGRRTLAAGFVVTALLPLAVILLADPIDGPERAVRNGNTLVPVDPRIALSTERVDGGLMLRWSDPQERSTRVFYVVYRGDRGGTDCSDDAGGATDCEIKLTPITSTREQSWRDPAPFEGAEYRIGIAANWVDDPLQGDTFVVSNPSVSRG